MTVDAASVTPVETATQAVECVDLSYQFGTHLAVDHVNLSIAPGEMYGLLGPNGAGKTTGVEVANPGNLADRQQVAWRATIGCLYGYRSAYCLAAGLRWA